MVEPQSHKFQKGVRSLTMKRGPLNKDLAVLESSVSKAPISGCGMVLRPQPKKVDESFTSTNEVDMASQTMNDAIARASQMAALVDPDTKTIANVGTLSIPSQPRQEEENQSYTPRGDVKKEPSSQQYKQQAIDSRQKSLRQMLGANRTDKGQANAPLHQIWSNHGSRAKASNIRQISKSLANETIMETPEMKKTPAERKENSRDGVGGPGYGPATPMEYERMPKDDSDLDSEKMTVNHDRVDDYQQVGKDDTEVVQEDKSDATLGTERRSAQKNKNSKSVSENWINRFQTPLPVKNPKMKTDRYENNLTQQHIRPYNKLSERYSQAQGETEQSVMTMLVVNDVNLAEQDAYQHSSDLQQEQEKLWGQKLDASEDEDRDGPRMGSHLHKDTSKFRDGPAAGKGLKMNHVQSQSLEQLPNVQSFDHREPSIESALEKQSLNTLQQPPAVGQIISNQFEFKSEVCGKDDGNRSPGGIMKQSAEKEMMVKNIKAKAIYASEFADTEVQFQDHILVSSQHVPDNSVTVRGGFYHSQQEELPGSLLNQEQQSVTDTNVIGSTAKDNIPRAIISQGGTEQESNFDELDPTLTEKVGSRLNSIDADLEDRVNLETFEEENSADWHRPSPKPSIMESFRNQTVMESNHDENLSSRNQEEGKIESALSPQPPTSQPQFQDQDTNKLYESTNGQEIADVTQDFLNRDVNGGGSVRSENGEAGLQQRSEMHIREETQWVNTSEQRVDEPLETQGQRKSHHSRHVKSIELRDDRNSLLSSHNGESGIEKYESDDNDEQKAVAQYASAAQTSMTKENQQVANAYNSSMVFTSMTDGAARAPHAISILDSNVYTTGGPQQTLSTDHPDSTQQQPQPNDGNQSSEQMEVDLVQSTPVQEETDEPLINDIRNSLISVKDQSTARVDEKSNDLSVQDKSTHQSAQEKSSRQSVQEKSSNKSSNHITIEPQTGEPIVSKKSAQSKRKKSPPTKRQRVPSQEEGQDMSRQQKSRRARRQKSSPNQSSPECKTVIQNGRLVQGTSKEIDFDKHQFPIRRSNYNCKKVENMLMSKEKFRLSVALMEKMKCRIAKYNKDIVPQSSQQQYYYALQQQQQKQSSSVEGQLDSLQYGNLSKNAQTPNSIETGERQSEIPDFRINNNAAVTQKQSLLTEQCGGIESFQVDVKGGSLVPTKRLSNSVSHHPMSLQQQSENNQSQTATRRQKQPSVISELTRREPDSVQEVRNSHDGLMKYSKSMQKCKGQNQRMIPSSLRETPENQSEFKFQPKRPNRRLILVDNGPTKQHQTGGLRDYGGVHDNSAERDLQIPQDGVQQPASKTTRTSFYPQDNLESLVQAAQVTQPSANNMMYAPGASAVLQKASLASKFVQNQIKVRRQLTKNKTIGKIYNQNNAQSLLQAVGAYPKADHYQQLYAVQGSQSPNGGAFSSQRKSHKESTRSVFRAAEDSVNGMTLTRENSSDAIYGEHPDQMASATMSMAARSLRGGGQALFSPFELTSPADGKQTAQAKFQKWLVEGSRRGKKVGTATPNETCNPILNIVSSARTSIRNYQKVHQGLPHATHSQQSQEIALIENTDSVDGEQTHDIEPSIQDQPPQQQLLDNTSFAQIAVKFLNNPQYGQTVTEREVQLRNFLKQNYPQDYARLSQRNQANGKQTPNTISSVSDGNMRISTATGVRNLNQYGQPGGVQMQKMTLSSGSVDSRAQLPKIQSSIALLDGLVQNPQQRNTLDPQRCFNDQPINDVRNLSQIYAVPQGKKRQVFLKNNYTRGNLLNSHAAKNNRMVQNRQSKSPEKMKDQLLQENLYQRYSMDQSSRRPQWGKSLRFRCSTTHKSNTLANSTTRKTTQLQQQQTSNSRGPSQISNVHMRGSVNTNDRSEISSAFRRQHHQQVLTAIEREDTFEHPQISLNMPQSNQNGDMVGVNPASLDVDMNDQNPVDDFIARSNHEQDEEVGGASSGSREPEYPRTPAIEIDSNLQILNGSPQQLSPEIDCVKELIVVEESKATLDVPQVLAEEDKNPNVPDQDDHIVGEQTVDDGDSNTSQIGQQAKVAKPKEQQHIYKQKSSSPQKPFGSSFKLASDSEEVTHRVSKEADRDVDLQDRSAEKSSAREDLPEEQDEEEEEEDYYADDKFVYDDNAEDPSSEDPEHKFFKKRDKALQSSRANSMRDVAAKESDEGYQSVDVRDEGEENDDYADEGFEGEQK